MASSSSKGSEEGQNLQGQCEESDGEIYWDSDDEIEDIRIENVVDRIIPENRRESRNSSMESDAWFDAKESITEVTNENGVVDFENETSVGNDDELAEALLPNLPEKEIKEVLSDTSDTKTNTVSVVNSDDETDEASLQEYEVKSVISDTKTNPVNAEDSDDETDGGDGDEMKKAPLQEDEVKTVISDTTDVEKEAKDSIASNRSGSGLLKVISGESSLSQCLELLSQTVDKLESQLEETEDCRQHVKNVSQKRDQLLESFYKRRRKVSNGNSHGSSCHSSCSEHSSESYRGADSEHMRLDSKLPEAHEQAQQKEPLKRIGNVESVEALSSSEAVDESADLCSKSNNEKEGSRPSHETSEEANSEDDVAALQLVVSELENVLQELHSSLSETTQESAVEISNLQNTIEDLKAIYNIAREEKQAVADERDQLKYEHDTLLAERSQLLNEQAGLRKERSELLVILERQETLEKELTVVKELVSQRSDGSSAEILNLKKSIENLQYNFKTVQNEQMKLRSERGELLQKIAALEQQLHKSSDPGEGKKDVESLKKDIENLKQDNAAIASEIKAFGSAIASKVNQFFQNVGSFFSDLASRKPDLKGNADHDKEKKDIIDVPARISIVSKNYNGTKRMPSRTNTDQFFRNLGSFFSDLASQKPDFKGFADHDEEKKDTLGVPAPISIVSEMEQDLPEEQIANLDNGAHPYAEKNKLRMSIVKKTGFIKRKARENSLLLSTDMSVGSAADDESSCYSQVDEDFFRSKLVTQAFSKETKSSKPQDSDDEMPDTVLEPQGTIELGSRSNKYISPLNRMQMLVNESKAHEEAKKVEEAEDRSIRKKVKRLSEGNGKGSVFSSGSYLSPLERVRLKRENATDSLSLHSVHDESEAMSSQKDLLIGAVQKRRSSTAWTRASGLFGGNVKDNEDLNALCRMAKLEDLSIDNLSRSTYGDLEQFEGTHVRSSRRRSSFAEFMGKMQTPWTTNQGQFQAPGRIGTDASSVTRKKGGDHSSVFSNLSEGEAKDEDIAPSELNKSDNSKQLSSRVSEQIQFPDLFTQHDKSAGSRPSAWGRVSKILMESHNLETDLTDDLDSLKRKAKEMRASLAPDAMEKSKRPAVVAKSFDKESAMYPEVLLSLGYKLVKEDIQFPDNMKLREPVNSLPPPRLLIKGEAGMRGLRRSMLSATETITKSGDEDDSSSSNTSSSDSFVGPVGRDSMLNEVPGSSSRVREHVRDSAASNANLNLRWSYWEESSRASVVNHRQATLLAGAIGRNQENNAFEKFKGMFVADDEDFTSLRDDLSCEFEAESDEGSSQRSFLGILEAEEENRITLLEMEEEKKKPVKGKQENLVKRRKKNWFLSKGK